MLDLKITCDRYADTNTNYHIQFIDMIKGSGFWETPIGNNSRVRGMTKEQAIKLTSEIEKTIKNYLEKEFPDYKDDSYFTRCFTNIE